MEKNPTFAAFIARARREYGKYSATPKENDAFVEQISKMWASEPNWTDAQLKAINAEVLVADGDHDEAIKREHTEYIAATIPSAGLLICRTRVTSRSYRTWLVRLRCAALPRRPVVLPVPKTHARGAQSSLQGSPRRLCV